MFCLSKIGPGLANEILSKSYTCVLHVTEYKINHFELNERMHAGMSFLQEQRFLKIDSKLCI